MTMNFFKKVMTFFSAIWNAILWRKTDKKAKQVGKSSKEEEQGENDSNPISESETLFVDVPLHSPKAHELSEQELHICDEVPAALAPVVAHNPESRPCSQFGIKKYSSGVQLFGFEDETGKSLSFFSEPLRDDVESEELLLSSTNETGERDAEENAVIETDLVEPEAIIDENRVNDVDEVFDLQASEELPTPPSDSISEDGLHGQKVFSELSLAALDAPSNSDDFCCSVSPETPKFTDLNDEVLVEIKHSTENLKPSTDHVPIILKFGINPDLNYLAIGDEMHLFDHDTVTDIFPEEIDECKKDEICQALETGLLAENDPISTPKSITVLGTAAHPINEDTETDQNTATSGRETVPIGVSVSSTQEAPAMNENALDTSSKYSTNYMVKSDSLVNFLPEGGSDPDVDDVANSTYVLETARKPMTHEEQKEIPLNIDIPLLKEGCLEEMMCSPRGILKLSGDHCIDCTDENDCAVYAPKKIHVKTTVEDFLIDAFEFDEPLLRTHHLEGCVLEETSQGCGSTEDSTIFREVLKTVETRLKDSESIHDLDAMANNEYATQPDTIFRCRSIIQDATESPVMSNRSRNDLQKESSKLGQDENEEGRISPCRLSQFTTFHLGDDSDSIGQLNRSDLLAPGTPTARYGEILARIGSSNLVPPERETNSSPPVSEEESHSTKRFTIDFQDSAEFLDGPGWRVTLPLSEEVTVTHDHGSTSLSYLSKQGSPILGIHNENSCRDVTAEKSCHTQDDEDMNDYYPFIDCSSYLFQIPEEIRKETSFNPCVGAAPSRRFGYASNADVESPRGFDDDRDGYENEYPNINSLVPHCVGPVPLINPCIPEEYKNTHMAKLPEGYNQRPVSQNVGTFWGAHPGIVHSGDQQQAVVGYPVSCSENYYEEEDLNVMSTATYQNDQTNICTTSEGYGYINPYGAVEFPTLSIPLCTPPSQSAFMPRGRLAPLIFPIGPMNVPQSENLPSLISLESTAENAQYPIPQTWGIYPANAHLKNDESEDKEITSLVEVRGLAPTENLSCTGTNDEDDNLDNYPIRDPYFQLADNNSLHTVKSKADSYSGSLFCESLRSLISHNTENENIFPSFSGSSVQGCCPSVVLQSCETTLSNDSLPSIIVEETNCSKSADEDYLATEKFMNDVNTALNESVLDQIRGRADLHSNLLGRGDGSMPMDPDQSEHEDHLETPENDVMLRNSLGENISINNSKLTLLDGVLGTANGGSQPDPVQNLCESSCESSNSAHEYCREVLHSLVENVLTTLVDQSNDELHIEIAETNADCQENFDESLLQKNPERDLIVQNMMFIDGVPDQVRQIWSEGLRSKQEIHEKEDKIVPTDEVVSTLHVLEEALKNSSGTIVDNARAFAGDDVPSRRGRRNRRRRKKPSDIESEIEPEPCSTEGTVIAMGDGIGAPQDQSVEPNSDRVEEGHQSTSKPGKIQSEAGTSKHKADGELFANENAKESRKYEQSLAKTEDEDNGHLEEEEEEEPGENPGNSSNNRRRRNRRRKRKN